MILAVQRLRRLSMRLVLLLLLLLLALVQGEIVSEKGWGDAIWTSPHMLGVALMVHNQRERFSDEWCHRALSRKPFH